MISCLSPVPHASSLGVTNLGTKLTMFLTLYTQFVVRNIYYPVLSFNPFPNKLCFLRVCSTSLWKTLWEKEKLLMTSNFSFPTVFSISLENFLFFSSNLKLSSSNSFSLEESKICHFGNNLEVKGIEEHFLERGNVQIISIYPLFQQYS